MGTVLVLADIAPVPGPESTMSARLCAAINAMNPEPPLVIVAEGALARLLPAIALSQRSSHRRVTEYVLIEPELPAVTDTWPDATVTLVSDDDWLAMQGRLRGWDVLARVDYAGPSTEA